MGLAVNAIVVIGMCCMFVSFLLGVYLVITKPPDEAASLLSADDLEQIAASANVLKNTVYYSNILDARMETVFSTQTLALPECMTLCNGTTGCQGFQISAGNKCELLANVANTLPFTTVGTNLFTIRSKIPIKALSTAFPAEISGDDVGTVITGATTAVACAPYCSSNNTTCKSFSVGPSGCRLKSADLSTAQRLSNPDGTLSYFLNIATHEDYAPAPAPAPAPNSS